MSRRAIIWIESNELGGERVVVSAGLGRGGGTKGSGRGVAEVIRRATRWKACTWEGSRD